ncbi:ROK family protein [Paenibacillus sp.]|uniref:ROK family protein n=1 Tax=Paenibacillus sp. TaxID=58172 RepID=UPI002D238A77|nr:ROK family protein [Paenibacillus sp.]HZG85826.1 ROK family protein [Paenibacillus sp.]
MYIGAIEAGGTKIVCGIGTASGEIIDRIAFPTDRPDGAMARIEAFFKEKPIAALGVASFGPIDLDPASPTYGSVTTTPKPGWSGFDFVGALRRAFPVPIGWDTDVNAAALGEATWGAAAGLASCVYYTVGTGIGVGVYAERRLVHGLVHPEGGHVWPRRHEQDRYEGNCPYHGDCLEGLASGPAIERRWQAKGSELPADHPAWEMEAHYLAQAVAGTVLLLSPGKVILGGGVMKQSHLFPMIREGVARRLNGYVSHEAVRERIDAYIVPPGLGDNAGLCGAVALGLNALGGGPANA